MNKNQFLEQLEKLLSDLPEEEREEAVAWYRDYFDDAGAENEADSGADIRTSRDTGGRTDISSRGQADHPVTNGLSEQADRPGQWFF